MLYCKGVAGSGCADGAKHIGVCGMAELWGCKCIRAVLERVTRVGVS